MENLTIESVIAFGQELQILRDNHRALHAENRMLIRMLAIHQIKHGPIEIKPEDQLMQDRLHKAEKARVLSYEHTTSELRITIWDNGLTREGMADLDRLPE